MSNAPASQISKQDADRGDFEMFVELCWRIHLRDGGSPRESMQMALKVMAETHRQIMAEGGDA